MIDQQNDILEFRRAAGQPIRTEPTTDIPDVEKALALNLISEELDELAVAIRDNDIVEIADAAADLMVVVRQLGPTFGINLDALWREVHASNMSKVNPDTGRMEKNEAGKVIKGPHFFRPDIERVLAAPADNPNDIELDASLDVIVAPSVAFARNTVPINAPQLAQLPVITIPLGRRVEGRPVRHVFVMAGVLSESNWPVLEGILRHNQQITGLHGKFHNLDF